MRAYELNADNFYIGFTELTEENKDTLNYTTVHMTIGYYKPKFNHDTQEWYEGATLEEIEEIKKQEEANRPPYEPTEVEKLTDKISILENENKLLNAQIEALNATNDFHEELIAEMAMLVYA